jgi:hypothetical protein
MPTVVTIIITHRLIALLRNNVPKLTRHAREACPKMQFALSGFQTRDYEEQAFKVLDFYQLSLPLELTEIDFFFFFKS